MLFLLIYNALKYTNSGIIMVKINVFETEVDHILKIKVRDTGCGMKEEQVQRLFSLF